MLPPIIYADQRKGDVARNYSDISKANKILNWRPKVDLFKGLDLTLKYFLKTNKN